MFFFSFTLFSTPVSPCLVPRLFFLLFRLLLHVLVLLHVCRFFLVSLVVVALRHSRGFSVCAPLYCSLATSVFASLCVFGLPLFCCAPSAPGLCMDCRGCYLIRSFLYDSVCRHACAHLFSLLLFVLVSFVASFALCALVLSCVYLSACLRVGVPFLELIFS